jgi:hypothetical protein
MIVPQSMSQETEQKTEKFALRLGAIGFGLLSLYVTADALLWKDKHVPVEAAKTEAIPTVKQDVAGRNEERKIPEIQPPAQTARPVERVRLPSPELLRASVEPAVKKAPAAAHGVQMFDSCVPACDTRDPRITATIMPKHDAISSVGSELPPPLEAQAPATDPSLLERGGRFLGQVAEVPGMTLDKSQQIIRFAADTLR